MWRWIAIAIGLIVLFLILIFPFVHAHAQHDHADGHVAYQSWENRDGTNCCNNQDCGRLASENERVTSTAVEIKIEDQWCPVEPRHYLRKGNAPDWSSAHVCISLRYVGDTRASCERLLCYQPRPSF